MSKKTNVYYRNIAACKPKPAVADLHKGIVAELRRLAVTEPQPDLQVDPDSITREWVEVIVKLGLPFHIVDSPAFRKALFHTAQGGAAYIEGEDTLLPHRTKLSGACLDELDANLEAETKSILQQQRSKHGLTLMSDGWTSIQARPILNCLAVTAGHETFIAAEDTTGQQKNAAFIAGYILRHANNVGIENVVAVVMDGAQYIYLSMHSSPTPSSANGKQHKIE